MDTYRGFPAPEVHLVDDVYYAEDEKFGWFQSMTESVVLLQWRDKVDTVLVADAVEMGLVERTRSEDILLCKECGLLIGDVFLHLEYHRSH